MFRNYINWRHEFKTDEVLNFDFPENDRAKEVYPHGYHQTDKFGRPIYIERIGALKINELFEWTTPERMMKYFVKEYERVLIERFPAASAAAGRRIGQSLCIIDLDGLSMSHFNTKT
jgi:hypothetical protein